MENFPINLDMYQAIVGFFLPVLIAAICRPSLGPQAKYWIGFLLVFIAAAIHLFFAGGLNFAEFPGTLLKILTLTIGPYLIFWKPSGIIGVIEEKVGCKDKEDLEVNA